ncbi:ketoacyl-synt-domain-containing protein [Periconia macrospinosa]|uniref:Ketoacyl-synt-domain-containing protein n=1 Tax=Periconia macrospinosa TaxID=97972 RepID=A0A2V1DK67_9PLEO|nr:ketoacyl-synt-domain-containing protein [Periconia macrospinosa]
MDSTFDIFVFGDETSDFREPLDKLCERRRGLVSQHFIQRLHETLREEIHKQPRHVQKQIPPFTDIPDLVKRYRESSSRNPILESTLTCICQLAMAFRIGAKVFQATQRLSTSRDENVARSWSTLVIGVQKEAAASELERFNKSKSLPKASCAYLSSASRDAVTISGPPETLKHLFEESPHFKQQKIVKLDIFGPFHAPHIYDSTDIEDVLQPIADTNIKSAQPLVEVTSGASRDALSDTRLHQLMWKVVHEILIEPLSFNDLLTQLVTQGKASDKKVFRVTSVGPSNATSSIVSALKTVEGFEITVGKQFGSLEAFSSVPDNMTKIAIVGMAGRFPSADTLENLWSVLEQGLDLHRPIPADRWDVDAHTDPTGKKKNTGYTPYGCFIEEPGLFDPKFFNMSPREAYQTDPMQRLGITTAYEALEMSGFVPNRTPSSMLARVGTFYGQTSDDWRAVNAAETIDTYYIPGTIRAFASGRINYHFKFGGPSYSVDTACSSSFAAIQLACSALRAKECDTAIAGGLNVMTSPDLYAGLSRAQFLSKTGSCKTFDDGADGFCRGDGVGAVVLKRLEDAEADNDPILAVVLGTATNHSADAVSMTQPYAPAQEFLYKKILNEAGVDARDVSYVEMHGTGTQIGDGTEMKSISNVFAPRHQGRSAGQLLHLGALKANIGHGEASAGIASLIKVLLMLQRNSIPPHVGIKGVINHTFPDDIAERGIRIALKETPWLRPAEGKRLAYLNNFGASGGNTGMLLEDAPRRISGVSDPRGSFVISLTARSASSLKKNIQNLTTYLAQRPNTSLASLSYTLTARRMHHPFRISFAASSIDDVIKNLASSQDQTVKALSTKPPKLCFLFTGQGSHYPALGKSLFEDSKQFRTDILDFDRIGRNQGFPSFLPLIDGTISEMNSLPPVIVQLGLSCIQMALARLWKSWGVVPSAVLGHSLGQYAALNVAGVLSVSDTIFLVGRRAELLEEKCTVGTHAMLAIGTSVDAVHKLLEGEELEVACVNGPRETVISGPTKQMMSYSKTVKEAGVKCIVLPTAYAFHSSQVSTIMDSLQSVAESLTFHDPEIPVISPLLQAVVSRGGVFGPKFLARHAREPVNFVGALAAAKKDGVITPSTIFLELGPTPVVSAFAKSNLGNETVTVSSLRKNEDSWKSIANALSTLHIHGAPVIWNEVYRGYGSSYEVLSLPSYSFDLKNYWINYTNNWQLTKGELIEAPTKPKKPKNRPTTASIQKIIKEDLGKKTVTLEAESDLMHPDLHEAIFGHLINGSALTPSAVYSDMALTLAGQLYRKAAENPVADIGMDIRHLEIIKPLIARPRDATKPHNVKITATAERPIKSVNVKYTSLATDGKTWDLHASCTIQYGDTKAWLADWARIAYLIRSRVNLLVQGLDSGATKKVDRKEAYELFSSLVHYNKKYHGMKDVLIDSKNFEAASLIRFTAKEDDGDFAYNPYWIDNITHLSGYVLNGSDAVDHNKTVYISHGWEYCKIARPISGDKTYRNYVKMQSGPKNTMAGDVYVFEDNEVVAVIGGVKFQAIPRTLLNKLLPPTNGFVAPSAPRRQFKKPGSKPQKPVKAIQKLNTPESRSAVRGETSPMLDSFMSIIADELGMETSELLDESEFANIGVDSLMSLSVTGRIREVLNIDVPTSLFTDNSTIGEAKSALLTLRGDEAAVDDGSSPSEVNDDDDDDADGDVSDEVEDEELSDTGDLNGGNVASGAAIDKILEIISDELGTDSSELDDAAVFGDMGVDSLMSLSITGRIREELEMDIPTSFFTDNPTVGDAKFAIEALSHKSLTGTATPYSSGGSLLDDSLATSVNSEDDEMEKTKAAATSILIRGNSKTASKILFLLPDGSGSATSYSFFPSVSPSVCIYGLNSPYMKTPSEYTNGIESVALQYLSEVRRRQESGPYSLGGWSAGGVLAYQVACELQKQGEIVENLILIDSPCPGNIEPLPSKLLHFIESKGLLVSQSNSANPPPWLIPHFEASVRNLATYKPVPMDPKKAPKTFIIWARESLYQNPNDDGRRFPRSQDEASSIAFLLDDRNDFGSNGWGELLGDDNITSVSTEGNHFTMIREPAVKKMSGLLKLGLGV